jgi:hypothetical protein
MTATAFTPQAAMMRAKRKLDPIEQAMTAAAVAPFRRARETPLLPITNAMELYWATRQCFQCHEFGLCQHRELSVALAEAERAGVPAGVLRRVGA